MRVVTRKNEYCGSEKQQEWQATREKKRMAMRKKATREVT